MSGAILGDRGTLLRQSVVQVIDGARGQGGCGGAAIAWGADASGLFVTSAHVVTRKRVTVITPDGRRLAGDVVQRDSERDLAMVYAPGASVPAVTTGDPYAMRPGSLVVAIGHPHGVRNAVSVGVFQAVGALPDGFGLNGQESRPWVQADVRLAPGNSGGPLADAEGRVIGVAAMIVAGVALAVPASDVASLLSEIA